MEFIFKCPIVIFVGYCNFRFFKFVKGSFHGELVSTTGRDNSYSELGKTLIKAFNNISFPYLLGCN